MSYPNTSSPSPDFSASGIYQSDIGPEAAVGGIIDNYTPVNKAGMKNSIGYQLSLIQNFVNKSYLGRGQHPVNKAYMNYVGDSFYPVATGYIKEINVAEIWGSNGLNIINSTFSPMNIESYYSNLNIDAPLGYINLSGAYSNIIVNNDLYVNSNNMWLTVNDGDNEFLIGTSGNVFLFKANGMAGITLQSSYDIDLVCANNAVDIDAEDLEVDVTNSVTMNAVNDIDLSATDNINLSASDNIVALGTDLMSIYSTTKTQVSCYPGPIITLEPSDTIKITGLPTSKPVDSNQLWVSGEFLMIT